MSGNEPKKGKYKEEREEKTRIEFLFPFEKLDLSDDVWICFADFRGIYLGSKFEKWTRRSLRGRNSHSIITTKIEWTVGMVRFATTKAICPKNEICNI
jgi:hypothetical protein